MDIFESHELSDEDKHLSDNESVEIALLLSGISDVQMIQDMRNTADKVLRFTKPPRGERLLAETLGMPIGEKVNRSMLLPCSHQRENSTAQIQSKIIDEAIRLFVEDISALDPTISLEKNDRGISVIDVIPIPDAVICGIHERIRTQKTCFDVLLRFDNTMDSTYLKTIYSLRIQEYETKRSEIGDNTAWNPPELLHKKPGWNRIEERIVKETLLLAESQGMPSPVISGIGRFPACTGLAQNDVYKIRMPPEGGLMEPRYHYWVNANPKSLLISEEQWKMIQKSEDVNGTNEYFQILFGKTEDIPSTERLQSMLDNIMNKGGNEA
jgi:hypothetical protein